MKRRHASDFPGRIGSTIMVVTTLRLAPASALRAPPGSFLDPRIVERRIQRVAKGVAGRVNGGLTRSRAIAGEQPPANESPTSKRARRQAGKPAEMEAITAS